MIETTKKEPIWTKSFISISLTHLFVFLVFYSLLTTLPIYVLQSIKTNEAQAALVVTVMLIAAILIRPFSGKMIETIGKKKILLISILSFTFTTILYLFFESFAALLIIRFIHGLSFGILTTVTGAIAADIVPQTRRGEGLGYFAMAMNISIVLGPFIGLTTLQYASFHVLLIILSIVMVVGVLFSSLVTLPQDEVIEQEKPAQKEKFSIESLFELKALPIAVIASFVGFSYSSIISFMSVFSHDIGLERVSSYFFLVFACAMILTRPIMGKIYDLKGARYVIIPSLFIFMIGLFVLSKTDSAFMLLLSAALVGLGYGSLFPSFQTIAVQSTSTKRSGHATATFFSLYDLGIAIGTYTLGLLVTFMGFRLIYLLCAGMIIIVLLLFIRYDKRLSKLKDC